MNEVFGQRRSTFKQHISQPEGEDDLGESRRTQYYGEVEDEDEFDLDPIDELAEQEEDRDQLQQWRH